MKPELKLRRAIAADAEFAYDVLSRTMREYAVQTFGVWQEQEAHSHTTRDAAAGRTQVIELGGHPVGVLLVDELNSHFQLEQLFILPEFQSRGIGTELVQALQRRAHAVGVPVRLRVLRVNPARRLYERLGFVITSEEPERLYMQSAP